ncbi:transporter [Bacteroides reticulotermitis JCM 10512]|uniref:Transporter n=2 Tax=Bacteroides reticulotermitis TaxID=1133319 RepID=W4UY37_9BACE|nr:transporter [Bacteroides reticulotermitis JCM 10512]
MISEIGRMNDLVVTYITNGAGGNVPRQLSEFIHEYIDLRALNQLLSEENILDALKNTVPQMWSLIAESINIIISILTSFIILLYLIFILLDYEAIAEGWLHLLPTKYRKFASSLVYDVQEGMNKYFRGQALVAFCVGILFSIGFLIIDFPMAIALGLFIGALNMVPYLQIIGFLPTTMLAILKASDTGQSFWIIIAGALAVFTIVQIIQDTLLVPKIMGKITGLNPAIILLSLSIWGSLMGILGMIIALPLTTLMLSYYQRFIINKEQIRTEEVEIADNQEIKQNDEK